MRWLDRNEARTKRILQVNLGFGIMTLYLLRLAHSATAIVCVAIGCAVLAAAFSNWGKRHAWLLKAMIPVSFCLYLILGFGLGLNAVFAPLLGKDPTLTDRTHIWSVLLNMHTNPLFGTGYESFWMGSRLNLVFQKAGEHINEAHNGYLEVYLNLGEIGLLLLVAFLISAYMKICKQDVSSRTNFGSLTLALWAVVVMYNITEAGFKHGLMWLALVLGAIAVPAAQSDEVSDPATQDFADAFTQSPDIDVPPLAHTDRTC
jgi:O-antigen ligase